MLPQKTGTQDPGMQENNDPRELPSLGRERCGQELVWKVFCPVQHHLWVLPLSTPPHLPSLRTMSGHSKVSSNLAGLTTLLHLLTDSKFTLKSISKESRKKNQTRTEKATRKISGP